MFFSASAHKAHAESARLTTVAICADVHCLQQIHQSMLLRTSAWQPSREPCTCICITVMLAWRVDALGNPPGPDAAHLYTVDLSNSLRKPRNSCSITAGRLLYNSMLSTAWAYCSAQCWKSTSTHGHVRLFCDFTKQAYTVWWRLDLWLNAAARISVAKRGSSCKNGTCVNWHTAEGGLGHDRRTCCRQAVWPLLGCQPHLWLGSSVAWRLSNSSITLSAYVQSLSDYCCVSYALWCRYTVAHSTGWRWVQAQMRPKSPCRGPSHSCKFSWISSLALQRSRSCWSNVYAVRWQHSWLQRYTHVLPATPSVSSKFDHDALTLQQTYGPCGSAVVHPM